MVVFFFQAEDGIRDVAVTGVQTCALPISDEQEPELAAALTRAAAGACNLSLTLGGFGVFPDFSRPRVLWVGIAPEPGLEILQHRVEQEFAPLGFPTEGRPFRRRVTLGQSPSPVSRTRSAGSSSLRQRS